MRALAGVLAGILALGIVACGGAGSPPVQISPAATNAPAATGAPAAPAAPAATPAGTADQDYGY